MVFRGCGGREETETECDGMAMKDSDFVKRSRVGSEQQNCVSWRLHGE